MPTVKLVVIGASGVGKTSLRGQYISGRFSNGYRATIGADFITKTLPHPSNLDDLVTLQIWDTAGQERFSSLSTAFFRGADAALLMFDVNEPETMYALTKWWGEFRERAPLADEDMEDFCCVVVGNKIDLSGPSIGGENGPVTATEALQFLDDLIPSKSPPPSPIRVLPPATIMGSQQLDGEDEEDDPLASSQLTERPPPHVAFPRSDESHGSSSSSSPPRMRSSSIAITPYPTNPTPPSSSPEHNLSKSRSHSSSRFYSGTMTTTHTALTMYHTPSSSVFDIYQSARSSPEPWSNSVASLSPSSSVRARRITTRSTGSTSSGSAVTITPSLFAREHATASSSTSTTPENGPFPSSPGLILPPPPARGPKLFLTSAKTGSGVSDVFEYIAQRVVRRWEYEERMEARRMHMREASAADTIRLDDQGRAGKPRTRCC